MKFSEAFLGMDRSIMRQIQRFAYWTQRAFGFSATHWTRLWLLAQIPFLALGDYPEDKGSGFWAALRITLVTLNLVLYWNYMRRPKQPDASTAVTLQWNPLNAFPRLMCLYISCFTLSYDITHASLWFQCATVALFFADCSDLPRQPSRLRVWLQSLTTSTPKECHENS